MIICDKCGKEIKCDEAIETRAVKDTRTDEVVSEKHYHIDCGTFADKKVKT